MPQDTLWPGRRALEHAARAGRKRAAPSAGQQKPPRKTRRCQHSRPQDSPAPISQRPAVENGERRLPLYNIASFPAAPRLPPPRAAPVPALLIVPPRARHRAAMNHGCGGRACAPGARKQPRARACGSLYIYDAGAASRPTPTGRRDADGAALRGRAGASSRAHPPYTRGLWRDCASRRPPGCRARGPLRQICRAARWTGTAGTRRAGRRGACRRAGEAAAVGTG